MTNDEQNYFEKIFIPVFNKVPIVFSSTDEPHKIYLPVFTAVEVLTAFCSAMKYEIDDILVVVDANALFTLVRAANEEDEIVLICDPIIGPNGISGRHVYMETQPSFRMVKGGDA